MFLKKDVRISLDEDLLKHIEEKRGDLVPRSRIIERLIRIGLKTESVFAD